MHVPVMPEEAIDLLAVRPDGIYLDATAGLGGHTGLIAQQLTTGTVIANDRDTRSLEMARRTRPSGRTGSAFITADSARWRKRWSRRGSRRWMGCWRTWESAGISSRRRTEGFRSWRMGRWICGWINPAGTTAADLVNHTDEKTLADLIYQFGEERRARKIARAIVRARPIRSTLHLADVVERAVPRTGRLHPATKTFMALRMAVNDEPEELDRLLEIGPELLKSGGRMVVISFMSSDDRKVKEKFRALGTAKDVRRFSPNIRCSRAKKRVRPNPASRSAKLRALEMN